MGGIISRKKKEPDSASKVDTGETPHVGDHSSVKSGGDSPSKNGSAKLSSQKKSKKKFNSDGNGESSAKKRAMENIKKAKGELEASTKKSAKASTEKGREANKKFQRKIYLKERAAKLRGRLKDRPTDQRALQEYAAVLYEQENYQTAPKVIRRVLATGDTSGEWYLKLGKCYFRRWAKIGNKQELYDALDCYKIAMKDPQSQRNPVHYFEIAAILLRLGRHQACLDTFGSLMSLFKDEYEWVAIAHYNIALVMMQRKNFEECLKLIKDLNISTLSICVERGKDTLFHLPYKIDNISINLEIATIHDCMGQKSLAMNLFYESWEIVDKYRMPGETMAFDYQLGCSSFAEWYNSASTFKKFGDMYRVLSNLIIAAEMYRMSAERILTLTHLHDIFDFTLEDWREVPEDSQNLFLESLLLRAECLAEVAEFDVSERYAGFIFKKRRKDVNLCGRAAKCCRRSKNNPQLIKDLQESADRMERGILLVQSQYRIRLAQVERENLKYGIKAGFKVTSFLKMLLVRNRMVEPRLSNCPTEHINLLVDSFLQGRIAIMKTGSEYLLNYIEMWYLAASTIQHCIVKWYARRSFSKFFKGIRGLERIFRGQIVRKRLRKYFTAIQIKLDRNIDEEERIDMTMNEKMKINYQYVERLCCGTTCISAEEHIAGTISLNARESPLRHKTRRDLRMKVNPATGRFEDSKLTTENPMLNDESMSRAHSRVRRSRSNCLLGEKILPSNQDCFEDAQQSPTADTQLPQINSFNFASPTSSSARRSSSQQKNFRKNSDRSDMSNDYSRNNTSRSQLSARSLPSARFTGKRYSAEVIQEFASRNPDEDVISFVSYLSVKDDATKQWIPFGVLPEREVIRLVQCTVLIISSPSFSMQDCKRMTHIIKKHAMDSWLRLKSLFVGGTRMGISGLRDILNLGITHMHSLTFSNTNMNHFYGEHLGKQLISSELVKRIKSNSKLPQTIDIKCNVKLRKLYIENEYNFGDRGFNALLKSLQINVSLQILIVRNCNITNRGAQSCARYIGVSNTIEIINISENWIDYEGYMNVINAVASRGFRGSLKKIYLTSQTPGYKSHEELLELYNRGNELGVSMVSDNISARELTMMEMMRVRDTDKEDIRHMHNVFKQILEDERLESENILTNSFKKVIYL